MTLSSPSAEAARRYAALVLSVLLVVGVLAVAAAAPARAAQSGDPINGITYSFDPATPETGATVVDYDTSFGLEVVIPDTVTLDGDDYAVTAIGERAFYNYPMTSVVLPDGLITIGDYAFVFGNLTSLALPGGLVSIGHSAFYFNDLTSIDLPDSLVTLAPYAFFGNKLTSVELPDGLVAVEGYAFYSNKLTSVTLPESVVAIGEWAFGYNDLRSVTIPSGVTTIGVGAFRYSQLLRQVHFTGPAPTEIVGADHDDPSLGAAPGLTVSYPEKYMEQHVQRGYSAPRWFGYSAHPATVTVEFVTGAGAAVSPVTVQHGALLDLPAAPVREGHTFTGWFTAPDSDTAFDPTLPVTEPLTLYAGWRESSVPTEPPTLDWVGLITGSLGLTVLAGAAFGS